jgi:hypothetical protein
MPNAKLGAKVDRYSFFVRLLPPLLHTGLARRTNIAITLTTVRPPTRFVRARRTRPSGGHRAILIVQAVAWRRVLPDLKIVFGSATS